MCERARICVVNYILPIYTQTYIHYTGYRISTSWNVPVPKVRKSLEVGPERVYR